MYYVYLLESLRDGTFYIGHCEDVEKRTDRHNSGRCKYTRSRTPWELLAYKTFKTRGAMREEQRLKKLKTGKRYLKSLD